MFATRMKGAAPALIALLIASAVYGSIYWREESVSTGIGANLVPAERILKGEIPYRDFYKIQTPGILLLNAGLFKLWGTSLLSSLRGVLIFKILSIAMVFVVARLVAPLVPAMVAALLALIWLPPGGPFRPAPIQYEMLFLLAALYFTLAWLDSKKSELVFAAGVAVGLVAVFKQNVGVYAAIALGLSVILNTHGLPRSLTDAKRIYLNSWKENGRAHIAAALGICLPLAAMLLYLTSNNALGAAMRVFIRGPGEHIQMKLTGYPLPKYAAIIIIFGALALIVSAHLVARWPKLKPLIGGLIFGGAFLSALVTPQAAIDNTIFWFAPLLFLFALWVYWRASGDEGGQYGPGTRERGVLLVLLMYALASYGEVFPRSVRGLIIGTMPPAFILMAFLLGRRPVGIPSAFSASGAIGKLIRPLRRDIAFATIAFVLGIFALRTILPHYFQLNPSRAPKFRADTELDFERGRGVYLPRDRAIEVNSTVGLIQSKVEPGGYFFAHALDATSYYFLSDRNTPTGATLWNDAGADDAERARTMQALKERQVRLVVTSEQALGNERYGPMADCLKNEFHQQAVIGKLIFLERNY
jgi:hypothetical protein